ncbi:MAG: zinc-ribbon domain-containing protein [Eubacterium sp.]|nr:zinc-ribbon domain-containing protein [Eubacterium sp.]
MPFCSNCGKEIGEDIKFCPNCGKENISVKPVATIPTENADIQTNHVITTKETAESNHQNYNSAQNAQQPPIMNNNQQVKLDKSKNDLLAWLMATVPITGIILGIFLPFGGWTCLILNIIIGCIDCDSLKKQGIDTSEFGGLAFLVPYYLYRRAKKLNDDLSYFIVWIVLFAISIFI